MSYLFAENPAIPKTFTSYRASVVDFTRVKFDLIIKLKKEFHLKQTEASLYRRSSSSTTTWFSLSPHIFKSLENNYKHIRSSSVKAHPILLVCPIVVTFHLGLGHYLDVAIRTAAPLRCKVWFIFRFVLWFITETGIKLIFSLFREIFRGLEPNLYTPDPNRRMSTRISKAEVFSSFLFKGQY